MTNPIITGIIIGIMGMALEIVNYTMYNGILNSLKKKYADQILKLSEKIMGNC